MDLRSVFTPAAVAAYWNEVASNREPYLLSSLFGKQQKAGLDLKWIRGSKGLPVSLMPSAFDAKATYRSLPGIEIQETEMPFFREGFKVKERDRQEMLRVQDSADPYAREVIARVFDGAADLVDGAIVVPERMIAQLLFPEDGKMGIAIKANGVDYTYEYDKDEDWKNANYTEVATKWSEKTADPFKDIKDAKNKVRAATGVEPTIAIMNSTTFNMLENVDTIRNRFVTMNGLALSYLTPAEIAAVVRGTVGVSIVLYDKQYKDEDGKAHPFVPDGYVALVPDGQLGTIWRGTTPEEADLRGSNEAEVEIVENGVAVTREIIPHPVNVNTIVSEIVLPSFERMDEVAVLKVGE